MSDANASRWVILWKRMVAMRRLAAVCAIVSGIAFVNWFVFFAYSVSMGGDAPGTVPSAGRFVVTSHGRETPVAERTWLISLFYTTASLLFSGLLSFPCFGFLVFRAIWRKQVEGEQDERKKQSLRAVFPVFLAVFGSFYLVWAALWSGVCTWDFLRSLRAYLSL